MLYAEHRLPLQQCAQRSHLEFYEVNSTSADDIYPRTARERPHWSREGKKESPSICTRGRSVPSDYGPVLTVAPSRVVLEHSEGILRRYFVITRTDK